MVWLWQMLLLWLFGSFQGTLSPARNATFFMFDPDDLIPKHDRLLKPDFSPRSPRPSGERLFTASLVILLVALGVVIYRNREFWFPENARVGVTDALSTSASGSLASKKKRASRVQASHPALAAEIVREEKVAEQREPSMTIEVVGVGGHKLLRPRTGAIEVNLDPNAASGAARASASAGSSATKEAAAVIGTTGDDVRVSVDTAEIVEHAEVPDYPLLARQMKIKGSVILDALIGRDGIIQSLDVVSGAPILADAAKAAVRQWHFKPHYLGDDTVETNTKIKVNFMISTY